MNVPSKRTLLVAAIAASFFACTEGASTRSPRSAAVQDELATGKKTDPASATGGAATAGQGSKVGSPNPSTGTSAGAVGNTGIAADGGTTR